MINQKEYYILTIFDSTVESYNGFEEVLRERIYHYKKSLISLDFWILRDIKVNNILKLSDNLSGCFEKSNKLVNGFTIITTNQIFIDWIRLRYGYFENILNYQNINYTIDGFYLKLNQINFINRKAKLFKK